MEYVILSDQKSIVTYIDELDEKLKKDNAFKDKIYRQYLPVIRRETNKNYDAISRLIEKEFNIKGYGKTTVWRVLKIKETNKEYFEKIKSGEVPIKVAYNKVFNITKDEHPVKEVVIEKEPEIKVREGGMRTVDAPYIDMITYLTELKEDFLNDDFREDMDIDKLCKMNRLLFDTHKRVCKLMSKYGRLDDDEY